MPEEDWASSLAADKETGEMNRAAKSLINFIIFLALVALLAGCASGPSAEPVACRGAAFQINPPSSLAPATPVAMAETETAK